MSKVLEALENDIESLYSIITQSRINKELKGWAHVWRDDIIRDLRKALTPPTADEIIKELNEYYELENGESYEFYDNKDYSLFELDMFSDRFKYWKHLKLFGIDDAVDIKLAHKITTFFLN